MTKKTARDRMVLLAIGISIVVLAIGFSLAWKYFQRVEQQTKETAYLSMPSIAISRDGHSIAATFAVRTSVLDADWAGKNKAALEQVMKRALLEVDPEKVRGPNGLKMLQDTVRDASNVALNTSRIQEVLVTDFLVSEADL